MIIMLMILQVPKGSLKRQPKAPSRKGHFVNLAEGAEVMLVEPIKYEYIG